MGWRRANCFPWLSTAVLGIQYNRNAAQPHVRCKGTQHGRRVACQSAASSVTDNDCLWIWIVTTYAQWRRLHMAQGAHAPLLQMAGHGAPRSIRRANKLTKLHCPSRKRSRKRLIVLVEPKKWRSTTKKNLWTRAPPLSNSFRRHCICSAVRAIRASYLNYCHINKRKICLQLQYALLINCGQFLVICK